jgi:competence protein ComEC
LLNGISHSSPSINARFANDSLIIQVVAAGAHSSPNDSSISIIGNARGMVFFAAGDLELEGQARALRALKGFRYRDVWDGRPIDLMKATHHGSALQDPHLVALLQPRTTFISVGAGNPYGHPTQSALELYGRFGTIYRTDTKRSLALAGRAGNLIVVAQPASPWAL